jgi:hypothetical protein
MTDVKNSRLYKTIKKAVRKEDHAELLRMLEMVRPEPGWDGIKGRYLIDSFRWSGTPQGVDYWADLSSRLEKAGHDCY